MQQVREKLKEGWKISNLGDIAEIKNGKSNTQDAVFDGEYPFFDRSALVKKSSKFIFDAEAIILPGEGAEFIPKYFKGKFDLHQRAYSIVPDTTKIDGVYLFYYLFAKRNLFVKKSVGSTVRSLRLPMIQSTPVEFPPLEKQKEITKILLKIDEDISKTDGIIKQVEKMNGGLIQELLTKGIGHKKFKKTRVGLISEDWKAVKLNEICNKITDGTHKTPKYISEGVPFLRVTDIQNKLIDWDDVKYISKEEHNELIKRCNPEKGDVLLSKNGTIGIVKIVDWNEEFSIFVSLCLIKPKKEMVNSVFLSKMIGSDLVLNQAKQRSKQGSVTNLHLEEIRDFDISLPSIGEQIKIADILLKMDEKINVYKTIKSKLEILKKGLMQDLLDSEK